MTARLWNNTLYVNNYEQGGWYETFHWRVSVTTLPLLHVGLLAMPIFLSHFVIITDKNDQESKSDDYLERFYKRTNKPC